LYSKFEESSVEVLRPSGLCCQGGVGKSRRLQELKVQLVLVELIGHAGAELIQQDGIPLKSCNNDSIPIHKGELESPR
jgi:hypothetical protein